MRKLSAEHRHKLREVTYAMEDSTTRFRMRSSRESSTSATTIESALPRVEMLMEKGWNSHKHEYWRAPRQSYRHSDEMLVEIHGSALVSMYSLFVGRPRRRKIATSK